MASKNFRSFVLALARAEIPFHTATLKAMLVTAIPDETAMDTWADRADVTSEHAATGGYTAGGFNVTVDSVTLDTSGAEGATGNRAVITLSCANPTYEGVTINGVVGCIIYQSTGTAANDKLITFVDFESTKGVTGGEFVAGFDTPLYINA